MRPKRRIILHGLALVLFVLVYLVATIAAGMIIQIIGHYQPGSPVSWWREYGAPILIMVIAGTIGAGMAVIAVGAVFRGIRMLTVAWLFVGLLAFQWASNGLYLAFGHPGRFADIQGVFMALAAAITAVEQATRAGDFGLNPVMLAKVGHLTNLARDHNDRNFSGDGGMANAYARDIVCAMREAGIIP